MPKYNFTQTTLEIDMSLPGSTIIPLTITDPTEIDFVNFLSNSMQWEVQLEDNHKYNIVFPQLKIQSALLHRIITTRTIQFQTNDRGTTIELRE